MSNNFYQQQQIQKSQRNTKITNQLGLDQREQIAMQQQQTIDAVIVQSNSNVVSDEFILQLQEQFGGENKQIYIFNTNQSSSSTSLSANTLSNGNNAASNEANNQIQYLIVDKDVDINVILQDPNIFNQGVVNTQNQNQVQVQQQQQTIGNINNYSIVNNQNLAIEQQQQQHQQQVKQTNKQYYHINTNGSGNNSRHLNGNSNMPLVMNNLATVSGMSGNGAAINQLANSIGNGATNNTTIINSSSLMQNNTNTSSNINNLAILEESIQRVQVPPPKRKQFEFKLENKRNSYQDVFLRYLAGEKQPTLEIISEHGSKKPKDNSYSTNINSINSSHLTNNVKHQTASSSPLSNQISTPVAITSGVTTLNSNIKPINNQQQITILTGSPSNHSLQLAGSVTGSMNVTAPTTSTTTTINLDKENYYNSSRRENLIPLNNYEYRNSYKDHYDNQGVRVNPAVLKNLSFSSQIATLSTSSNANGVQNVTASNSIPGSSSISNGLNAGNRLHATNNSTSITISPMPVNTVNLLSSNTSLTNSNPNNTNKKRTSDSTTQMAVISENSNSSKSSIVITKLSQSNNSGQQQNSNDMNSLFSFSDESPKINPSQVNVSINENDHLKLSEGIGDVNVAKKISESASTPTPLIKNETQNNQQQSDAHNKSHIEVDVTEFNHNEKKNLNLEQSMEISAEDHSHHNHQQHLHHNVVDSQQQIPIETSNVSEITNLQEEVTFTPGEFLIHKSTFSGDFDNYDIWCVLDDGYLQKYEPVLLATGERCHQSAEVLAQYTPDKNEFILVKVDEKGKTEQNNIVVGVLNEYEPKNRKIFQQNHQQTQQLEHGLNGNNCVENTNRNNQSSHTQPNNNENNSTLNNSNITNSANTNGNNLNSNEIELNENSANTNNSESNANLNNIVVVTYDDLKTTLDVFLQVLLSQHLNGEFLVRIKELQDEYFKPSIEFIDTILNEKFMLLLNNFSQFISNCVVRKKNVLGDPVIEEKNPIKLIEFELEPMFKYLLETKPKLTSSQADPQDLLNNREVCQAIVLNSNVLKNNTMDQLVNDPALVAQYVIKFSGKPYNFDTLMPLEENGGENSDQIEKDAVSKPYFVCAKTLQFAQTCHALKHLKINFYEICQQKIETVKQQINDTLNENGVSNTAASDILNYCLADTQWLLEMFEKFKQLLFDVDGLLPDENSIDSSLATASCTNNQNQSINTTSNVLSGTVNSELLSNQINLNSEIKQDEQIKNSNKMVDCSIEIESKIESEIEKINNKSLNNNSPLIQANKNSS